MDRLLICSLISLVIASIAKGEETKEDLPNSTLPSQEVTSTQSNEASTPKPELSDKNEPAQKSSSIEKVEVLGTHIKRIDIEGIAPVKSVTRKELEKSGYNSVADVMRDTTVSSFGSMKEASGSNAAGVAEVNLRGLGASNTLVLLNGQRLPADAVTGAVDLNLIPMAAVERIEILKDGASAIYGSDALGGVVNIITRKDFSGSQVALATTVPQQKGGARQEVSLVNGFNTERTNTVTVVQYRDNDAVYSRDREWSNQGVSNNGSPGSYKNPGGKWFADPSCPVGQIVTTPAGTFCSFKYSDYSTELPALQQLSLLSETNMELTSRVRLVGRIGGSQKRVQWSYAPSPGTFVIPGAVADGLGSGGSPLPGVSAGQNLQVRYRLTELGTRDADIVTNSLNLLLGSSIDLLNEWQLDVTGAHNKVETKDSGVNGYALTESLEDAISSGNYNPFGTTSKGSLENTRYVPVESTSSSLSSIEIKSTGPIGQIQEKPISLAVGSTLTSQKYEDNFDEKSVNDEVFGNAGSSGGGTRQTRSLFTEFSVPVPGEIELQLAGRYDHYSDFGDTFNPKIGVLYHATPTVLIRGSVGSGFKAPLMQNLYAATSNGYPTFIDHVSCQREQQAGGDSPSCIPQQYNVTSGGNKNLKEEKSVSINTGVVFEPNRNFNIGTDLFHTKLNNVVGIDYSEAMLAESQGVNLAQYGVIVHRDATGYLDSIEAPLQNLSAQELAGIDLSTSYSFSSFKVGMEHSQLFFFREEGFPGTGLKNKLGSPGRPQWRNVVSFGAGFLEAHEASLVALTTAGQEKSDSAEGKLPNYTTFDLHYDFKSKKVGTVSLGVKNLLGSTPPLDETVPGKPLDATIYDQIGRIYTVGYKMNF